ncbi:hypothetical protein BD0138_04940 [Helicobacter pylori]
MTEFNQRVRYAIFKSIFGIFGLDAKRSSSDEFLEIKQVSFQSKTWSATFNDTTLEKAKVFCGIKTTLAVGVWNNISNLLFIVYGKHPEIGLYLESKVKECHDESRRSTQTIGVSKLIKEFDFKMKPIDLKEQELINLFNLKFGHFSWENHLA